MANEIYNTTWWGNAIDTAITAGTEPDFFGSQMKMLTGQPELVTNGDFATDSDWSTPTGWSISNGTLQGTNANEISATQGGFSFLNKSFKVEYTITEISQGGIKVFLGGSQSTPQRSAVGTYVEYIDITSGNSTLYIYGINNFTGKIDNVSVKIARAEKVEAVKCLADWIHTTALQDLNN
jgi:hypothetical protein